MSLNSSKAHRLCDAVRAIASASAMLVDLPEVPTGEDLQTLINAATQADQASRELRILEGIIRGTTRN